MIRLAPAALAAVLPLFVFCLAAIAQTSTTTTNSAPATASPPLPKFKAVDVDNHNLLINRPGTVTLVLCTGEDSQDAAREAGETVNPLRGRTDFQLIVVVDLRDSIAGWVPSVAISQMRSNLDEEAIALKPYFLKNGNKGNPRNYSYVIADFKGVICPQLGWKESSSDLRGILFGGNGREVTRWDKLDDMDKLQTAVRAAISAYDDVLTARIAQEAKIQGTKLVQPPKPPPPLPPLTPAAKTE